MLQSVTVKTERFKRRVLCERTMLQSVTVKTELFIRMKGTRPWKKGNVIKVMCANILNFLWSIKKERMKERKKYVSIHIILSVQPFDNNSVFFFTYSSQVFFRVIIPCWSMTLIPEFLLCGLVFLCVCCRWRQSIRSCPRRARPSSTLRPRLTSLPKAATCTSTYPATSPLCKSIAMSAFKSTSTTTITFPSSLSATR